MSLKQIVAGLCLLFAGAALTGCQTTSSLLAGTGDMELTPQRADFADRYFSNPNGEAFAISQDGTNVGQITCPALRCAYQTGSAEKDAIKLCESQGKDCAIFAVRNKIVWQGQITMPDLPDNLHIMSLKRRTGSGFQSYSGAAVFSGDQSGKLAVNLAFSKCSGDFSRKTKRWSLACDNEETFSGKIRDSEENLLWGLSDDGGVEFRVSQRNWTALTAALADHAETANATPQSTPATPPQRRLSTTVSPNAKRLVTLEWENRFERLEGDIEFVNSTKGGRMVFDLPENGGRCIGAFAITAQTADGARTGEWQMSCPKFVTAEGVFDIDQNGGRGVGKDSNGNALTFTLSDIQRGL